MRLTMADLQRLLPFFQNNYPEELDLWQIEDDRDVVQDPPFDELRRLFPESYEDFAGVALDKGDCSL